MSCANYFICCNNFKYNTTIDDVVCHDCHVMFSRFKPDGKLVFKTSQNPCQICKLEKPNFVERLSCKHLICTECFRSLFFDLSHELPSSCGDFETLYDYLEFKRANKTCLCSDIKI